MEGRFVDGKLTLGENIADLSGLAIAHKALSIARQNKPKQMVAGWNSVQREHLEDNPPESSLTQILSFDEPEIEVTPEMSIPIPDFILDAESEESSNGLGLQSDGDFSSSDSDQSAEAGGSSGGGALGLKEILILFLAGIVLIARPMRQSV